jgi:hypothetical protein
MWESLLGGSTSGTPPTQVPVRVPATQERTASGEQAVVQSSYRWTTAPQIERTNSRARRGVGSINRRCDFRDRQVKPAVPPSEGPQLRASEATRSPLPPTTPETRHLSHRHRAVPAVVERRAKKQPIPRRPKGWTRGTTTSPKPRRADNPPSAVRGRPSVAWGPLAGSALVGPRPDTLLAPLHLPRSPGGLVTLLGKAGTLSLLADRSATGPGPLP